MPYPHPFYFLSTAFSYPEHDNLKQMSAAVSALAWDMGMRDIEPEALNKNAHDELQAEYVRLFINAPGNVAAPPYASIYIQNRGILFQQGHGQAVAFYHKAGLEPVESGECGDHISHELAFIGQLLDEQNEPLLHDFLSKHVFKWYPFFLQRLLDSQPCLFYKILGQVTDLCLKQINKEVAHE